MNTRDFNNYFGDMDLFLMDLVLKGHVAQDAKVLDVGCGEGRNGIHFIQQGFEYHGWDTDTSKLKMLEFLSSQLSGANAHFKTMDLRSVKSTETFDLIICSRVLHFAESIEDFHQMWTNLTRLLNKNGVLFLSVDSTIDNGIGSDFGNGKVEFPDGKIRFALTSALYEEMKKGFEEIEPLRTLVHHNLRAQSFICFRKVSP